MDQFKSIENLIKGLQAEVRQGFDDVRIFKEELESMKNRVTLLEDVQADVIGIMNNNTKEVKKMEEYRRRNNLIIYNLEECSNESNHDLRESVLEMFSTKLGITIDARDIDSVVRLGKIRGKRPVLVRIHSYWLKIDLMKESKKLKGTGLGISNDYPPDLRAVRKQLHPYLRMAKDAQCQAQIRGDKLLVNDVLYSLKDLSSLGSDATAFSTIIMKDNTASIPVSLADSLPSSQEVMPPSQVSQSSVASLVDAVNSPVAGRRSNKKSRSPKNKISKRKRANKDITSSQSNTISKFVEQYEERLKRRALENSTPAATASSLSTSCQPNVNNNV